MLLFSIFFCFLLSLIQVEQRHDDVEAKFKLYQFVKASELPVSYFHIFVLKLNDDVLALFCPDIYIQFPLRSLYVYSKPFEAKNRCCDQCSIKLLFGN